MLDVLEFAVWHNGKVLVDLGDDGPRLPAFVVHGHRVVVVALLIVHSTSIPSGVLAGGHFDFHGIHEDLLLDLTEGATWVVVFVFFFPSF